MAAESWRPETFMLDNGMQVVVLPDHRAPVVTHMVWYKVGSADEPASTRDIITIAGSPGTGRPDVSHLGISPPT